MSVQTRANGPYGEHMVCVLANAPDDATEDRLARTFVRVREFDADASYLAESDPSEWDDSRLWRAYENESRDIGEDGR